jgi:predicted small secreted protein
MKRKRTIIGILLAAGLTLTAAFGTPGYGRIVSSAHSFQRSFHALQSTGSSLGPVERFVYSLVLSARTGKTAGPVHGS